MIPLTRESRCRKAEMIVYVSSIDMGGNDNWKVFAPQFVGELNTDGVSDVGCYLTGLVGLVSVLALYI